MINDINEKYLKGDSFNLIDFSTTGLQKDGTFKFDKQKINIEIETKYEVVKNRREAKQKIDESGGFGTILMSLSPLTPTSSYSNKGRYDKIYLDTIDGADVLSHEIGHDFGFKDKYVTDVDGLYYESRPLAEHLNTLMGTRSPISKKELAQIGLNVLNLNITGTLNISLIDSKIDKPYKKGDVVSVVGWDFENKTQTKTVFQMKVLNNKSTLGVEIK
ncbi:MAG: hypothetical protein GX931_06290 [Acholeplasmataceae bacterium]|nr:hypothetical protein [Acholeplasmataceae bacterium]